MPELSDVRDLVTYVWHRHRSRMTALGNDEWQWLPTDDPHVGLRWRLDHIAAVMVDPFLPGRLGLSAAPASAPRAASSAGDALRAGEMSYDTFRQLLDALDDAALDGAIGPLGGPYADASRRSLLFHVVDELIHHTAEAALLRDLYARR